MTKGIKIAGALYILFLCRLPLTGQVLPVPLPGGDIIQPFGLFNQFFPGVGAGFDGLNADPHGINNSRTFVAMATPLALRPTATARPTTSSPTSVCIRGITWERNRMVVPGARNP